MKQNPTQLYILMSLLTTSSGIYILIKKDISIRIGRGTGDFGKVPVTKDSIRYVLGLSALFGGILMGIPFILLLLRIHFDYVDWLPILGMLIVFSGFIFSLIFQFAVFFGEWIGKK